MWWQLAHGRTGPPKAVTAPNVRALWEILQLRMMRACNIDVEGVAVGRASLVLRGL